MSRTFSFTDSQTLDDLQVFLARAARIDEGSVRLIAGSGVLAVYIAVLSPVGLLDESPTVLGLRTIALANVDGTPDEFDAVVPIRSLLTRLENAKAALLAAAPPPGAPSPVAPSPAASANPPAAPITVSLPMEVNTVTWAAISPPRDGWRSVSSTTAAVLEGAARAGIDDVAATIPDAVGEQIVRKVRSEVWARPIPGLEHVPAGAGFAALGLGFLGEDEVRVFETGPWTRLTTQRGHVLVKRKAWTLAR